MNIYPHTEVTISHRAKLSGIYETEVWDKFHMEGFHSRVQYTKANYFEGVATQENNDLGSKRLFASLLLPVALFCGHTSMQLFTITNKE